MADINKLIEETERLLAAATQAHIRPAQRGASWGVKRPSAWVGHHMSEPDAHLFAAAPAALRALVDEVKRLRQQVVNLTCDRTAQPNADWEPTAKTLSGETTYVV